MSASAWNPSGQITQITGVTVKTKQVTATAGQTSFIVDTPFTAGLNQLEVHKNGVYLNPSQVTENSDGSGFSIATCTLGDVVTARTFTPTTDQFQSLATSASNSAIAAASSAASALAVYNSIFGLTGTVIGSGNLTFAGTNQQIVGDVGLNVTRDLVTTGAVISYAALGFKNKIINGDFGVWVRGTSFSTNGYTADRWYGVISGTVSIGKSGTPNSPLNNYYAFWATSAPASYANLRQALERASVYPLRGKTVTVSFNAQATGAVTGFLVANLYYSTSTDTLASVTTVLVATSSSPVTLSSTWKQGKAIFVIPTDAVGLVVSIDPSAAQAIGVGVSIADVQLELGGSVTPFETRHPALELANCRRFFLQSTAIQSTAELAYQMRTTPTQTGSGPYNYSAEL